MPSFWKKLFGKSKRDTLYEQKKSPTTTEIKPARASLVQRARFSISKAGSTLRHRAHLEPKEVVPEVHGPLVDIPAPAPLPAITRVASTLEEDIANSSPRHLLATPVSQSILVSLSGNDSLPRPPYYGVASPSVLVAPAPHLLRDDQVAGLLAYQTSPRTIGSPNSPHLLSSSPYLPYASPQIGSTPVLELQSSPPTQAKQSSTFFRGIQQSEGSSNPLFDSPARKQVQKCLSQLHGSLDRPELGQPNPSLPRLIAELPHWAGNAATDSSLLSSSPYLIYESPARLRTALPSVAYHGTPSSHGTVQRSQHTVLVNYFPQQISPPRSPTSIPPSSAESTPILAYVSPPGPTNLLPASSAAEIGESVLKPEPVADEIAGTSFRASSRFFSPPLQAIVPVVPQTPENTEALYAHSKTRISELNEVLEESRKSNEELKRRLDVNRYIREELTKRQSTLQEENKKLSLQVDGCKYRERLTSCAPKEGEDRETPSPQLAVPGLANDDPFHGASTGVNPLTASQGNDLILGKAAEEKLQLEEQVKTAQRETWTNKHLREEAERALELSISSHGKANAEIDMLHKELVRREEIGEANKNVYINTISDNMRRRLCKDAELRLLRSAISDLPEDCQTLCRGVSDQQDTIAKLQDQVAGYSRMPEKHGKELAKAQSDLLCLEQKAGASECEVGRLSFELEMAEEELARLRQLRQQQKQDVDDALETADHWQKISEQELIKMTQADQLNTEQHVVKKLRSQLEAVIEDCEAHQQRSIELAQKLNDANYTIELHKVRLIRDTELTEFWTVNMWQKCEDAQREADALKQRFATELQREPMSVAWASMDLLRDLQNSEVKDTERRVALIRRYNGAMDSPKTAVEDRVAGFYGYGPAGRPKEEKTTEPEGYWERQDAGTEERPAENAVKEQPTADPVTGNDEEDWESVYGSLES